jgi:hypothetical protein
MSLNILHVTKYCHAGSIGGTERYVLDLIRGLDATCQCYDWKARSPLAWLIGLKDFCRWQFGQWRGPSPDLRHQHPAMAGDLHDLHQRLVWGRSIQALLPFWQ